MLTLLAVVGCFAEGTLTLTNYAVAVDKESCRPKVIVEELRKMGARITTTDDGMVITTSALHGAHLLAHHDHRVAMAVAVGAFAAEVDCSIDGQESVNKSFPDFFNVLALLREYRSLWISRLG